MGVRQAPRAIVQRLRLLSPYVRHFGPVTGPRLALRDWRAPGPPAAIPQWSGAGEIYARPGTADLFTYMHILALEEYEVDLAREPTTIVDAGANVGYTSVWFARKHPNARILAIEPEQDNYELLVRNVAPYPNVTPIRGAVWGTSGTISLLGDADDTVSFRVGDGAGQSPQHQVRAYTVDELMREFDLDRIDLLKIDIEGAEREVFAEAGWLEYVDAIAIELHDRFAPGCTRTFYRAIGDAFPREERRGELLFAMRAGG